MQTLASRCWPYGLHPGGLGWSMATGQLADTIMMINGPEGELVGWAGLSQPGSLSLQVAPDNPDVRAELIMWLTDTADGPRLSVDVYDDAILDDFRRIGFEPTSPPFGYYRMGRPGLRAAADSLGSIRLHGYTIRSVRPDEADRRVTVHRAAWRPVDLPFNPDRRPDIDESWSSSFILEQYRRVRSTELYDIEFDLVAVAPDGSFAACCIGWLDSATGWVEIEPLGVVPDHRRRGLALALCAEVARRAADRGAHDVFINTGPSELYPAPYAAYRKAGFAPFVRSTTLVRQ